MRDDEIRDSLTADLVTALGTPESLGVGRIMLSTGGDDFLSRDLEGQLPAVGVAEVDLERVENVGIGSKKWKGKLGYEVSIAADTEGEGTVAGRDVAWRVMGLINKALDYRQNPYRHRFMFVAFSIVPHPRSSAVVGVARFETSAVFGNE